MGLDMYAYSAARNNAYRDYWDGYDHETQQSNCPEPRELAYWRKHPNLHGWMERLWESKGCPGDNPENMFNGVELELTWEDLDQLEQDILSDTLPDTQGFFFGSPSDDYYRDQDLEFVRQARADLFMGLRVFYNSSW
jgi:hypothetical protein